MGKKYRPPEVDQDLPREDWEGYENQQERERLRALHKRQSDERRALIALLRATGPHDVSMMRNHTIVEVKGMEVGSDHIEFVSESGMVFKLYHQQDCCESVALEDIIGDPSAIIGAPLLMAEEATNEDGPRLNAESYTWSFYKFATVKGYVTLRWLGESNGYYSEAVYFGYDIPAEFIPPV
jgi:hypothetical protein